MSTKSAYNNEFELTIQPSIMQSSDDNIFMKIFYNYTLIQKLILYF